METAEEIVTIMECCSAAYQKRKEEKPSEAILVMLTTRCHSQLISNTIQKDRSAQKQVGKDFEARLASEKQLKYIDDLVETAVRLKQRVKHRKRSSVYGKNKTYGGIGLKRWLLCIPPLDFSSIITSR